MSAAHVICNNDSIECVVIGDEKTALEVMAKLKAAFDKENPHFIDYAFWHLHYVVCFDKSKEEEVPDAI